MQSRAGMILGWTGSFSPDAFPACDSCIKIEWRRYAWDIMCSAPAQHIEKHLSFTFLRGKSCEFACTKTIVVIDTTQTSWCLSGFWIFVWLNRGQDTETVTTVMSPDVSSCSLGCSIGFVYFLVIQKISYACWYSYFWLTATLEGERKQRMDLAEMKTILAILLHTFVKLTESQ